MSILHILKKIPIDLGQAKLKHTTKGKKIALTLIPRAEDGSEIRTALDVGCRDGYYSRLLRKRGYTVTSIDIECQYEHCQTVDANAPLPYDNDAFDLIWCSEVIEHLQKPEAVIAEFKRVLKPDGIAVLTTPNSFFWLYYLLKPFGLSAQKLQNPTHLHFFRLADIQKLGAGEIYGFFPYLFLKRTIRKGIGPLSPTFVFTIKK